MNLSDQEAERILLDASKAATGNDVKSKPKALQVPVIRVDVRESKMFSAIESESDALDRIERQAQADRLRLLSQSAIPERYRDASLSDMARVPEADRGLYADVVSRLKKASTGGSIVGLCGSRGPGKTHMACALVSDFCNRGIRARYATAMDIFLAIKREYGRQGGDESVAERQFLEPALLVIDEIQVRGETPWEDIRLTHLLDKRYANLKTTILITNLTRSELQKSVGESITDRFFDSGGVIDCRWQSLRGRLLPPVTNE